MTPVIMNVRMKKVFLYVVIGLLLLAIPAGVFYLSQNKDIRTRAAPATTLTLTPALQTVNVGDNLKLNVDIDPGSNQVVSADIYLTYDPTQLEAATITNGAAAPRVLNSGIIENGTASIKVGAASDEQPIVTRGTIAVLTLTAKSPTGNLTPSVVKFATNTFVGGLNEPTANVLIGTTPAKITITGPGAAASGSAAFPEATPNATPVPTSSLTPTPSATGSAAVTPPVLKILSPEENASVITSQPIINGTASPSSTITIVIHSDTEQTVTITADKNGNWAYKPISPLSPGPHSVVASGLDASGTTQTSTTTFVVAGGTGTDTTGATVSALPVSGTSETTLFLLGVGILFIASGALVWHF